MKSVAILLFIAVLMIIGCDHRNGASPGDNVTGLDDFPELNMVLITGNPVADYFYHVYVYNQENSLKYSDVSLFLNNSPINLTYVEENDTWEGDFKFIDIDPEVIVNILDTECFIDNKSVLLKLEIVNEIWYFYGPGDFDIANGATFNWGRTGDVLQQYVKGEKSWLDGNTPKYNTKNKLIKAENRSFDMPGNWLGPPKPYNEYAFTLSCMNYDKLNGFMAASSEMSIITYSPYYRTIQSKKLSSSEVMEEFKKIQNSLK